MTDSGFFVVTMNQDEGHNGFDLSGFKVNDVREGLGLEWFSRDPF